ncbi:MAG: TRAP transporter small permease [Acetivibrionales bacterium]|jgi:C4-dicarboxylate transporter DctQ subunit
MKEKIIKFFNNFELHLMVVLMFVFCINIFSQVLARVFFNYPIFFTEEVSRYAFLWMVFLGLSYATLYDKHIRVTFIVAKFPDIVQKIIEIVLHVLAIAVFCWVFVTSIAYLEFSSTVVTPALRIPKSIIATILPTSAVLTIIRSIQKVVLIIVSVRKKEVKV